MTSRTRPAPAARYQDPGARSVPPRDGAQARRVAAGRRSRPALRALTSRSLVSAVAAAAIGVGASSVRPVQSCCPAPRPASGPRAQ